MSVQVLVPLALCMVTAIAGSVLSAPGDTRLLRFADQHGSDHPGVRQRLLPQGWLNRTDLRSSGASLELALNGLTL